MELSKNAITVLKARDLLKDEQGRVIESPRAKRVASELANFNISVAVTDAYMEALRQNGEYSLINPRSGDGLHRS